MKKNPLTIISWLTLLAAILIWCGVIFLGYWLWLMQQERTQYLSNAAAASLQQGQAARLKVLARETEQDRATLESAAGVDVLSVVNAIESVAVGGVQIKVTDAQAERPVGTKPDAPPVNTPTNAVILSLQADGSFASLMKIIQMLETLPLATTVQAVAIHRASIGPSGKDTTTNWKLNVRLRFITSMALPS